MFKTSELSPPRNGVILLIVLSALTFFSILVAAFLVFSNESRATSYALSRSSTRTPDVDAIMEEALMTLVRGTDDKLSPFYGEDLLSDFYGTKDFIEVTIQSNPTKLTGGYYTLTIQCDNGRPTHLPEQDNAYTGRLITFTRTDSRANEQTFRIIKSVNDSNNQDTITIELKPENAADLVSGNKAVVNGLPRSATGAFAGTSPLNPIETLTTKNDGKTVDRGVADTADNSMLPHQLQPNHLYRRIAKGLLPGDFDEDYDAADFNNWWLSHRREDGSIIPSFHRPAVLNYILNPIGNATPLDPGNRGDLLVSLQRATFRPLPFNAASLATSPRSSPSNSTPKFGSLNQEFTGGNEAFALRVAGPADNNNYINQLLMALIGTNGDKWDVDNDLDGKPDSIWVDLGLPTLTTPTGKLIRPLVAPMIEDLGGRLNVNAHGNLALVDLTNKFGSPAPQNTDPNLPTQPRADWATNSTGRPKPEHLFCGEGFGPAEINIPALSTNALGLIRNIIRRRYLYGVEQGKRPPPTLAASPEKYYAGRAGRDALNKLMAAYRPQRHYSDTGFGYANDLYGTKVTAMGLNGSLLTGGQPRVDTQGMPTNDPQYPWRYENWNTPYELDPSGGKNGDTLWTLEELERDLRSNSFDTDLLPDGSALHQLIASNPQYANVFTTKSVSSDHLVRDIEKLVADIVELDSQVLSPAQARNLAKALLAPEFTLRRKLDVNRPLGNLVDDDDDGIIDEPSETNQQAFAFPTKYGNTPEGVQNQIPNFNVNGLYDFGSTDGTTARELMARHLYILMMAISRDDLDNLASAEAFFKDIFGGNFSTQNDPPLPPPPPPPPEPNPNRDRDFYKARRLAQWAVNAVDYRDPDSIMTRFVFDDKPFNSNGWSPPDPNTINASSPKVVWGVEQPQLVFSESMAFHDVRLRDDDRDNALGGGEFNKNDINDDDDNNSDQVRIPQGSLFLELYCPQPTLNSNPITKPGVALDFYEEINNNYELKLDATAPGGAPVWRIAISERHDTDEKEDLSPQNLRKTNAFPDVASFEPRRLNEIDAAVPPNRALSYDRFILFTNYGDTGVDPEDAFDNIRALINANNISDMQAQQVFYAPANLNVDRNLAPGQFLTLAPRLQTHFGSKFASNNLDAAGNVFNIGKDDDDEIVNPTRPTAPSDQTWRVTTAGIVQTDHDANPLTPQLAATGQIGTPALPLVIAAPRPGAGQDWTLNGGQKVFSNGVVGLSVSEPLPRGPNNTAGAYYDQPNYRYFGQQNIDYPLTDAYLDYSDQAANTALDDPLDVDPQRQRITKENGELELGTIDDYCSAFLQRLADPKKAYNAVTNPYRTVDWLPIDLTVFSGEDSAGQLGATSDPYSRRSRQRNGHIKRFTKNAQGETQSISEAGGALYSYETNDSELDAKIRPTAAPNGDYFEFNGDGAHVTNHLQSSFSFLNTRQSAVNPGFIGFEQTLGSLATATTVTGNDRNLPSKAYAIHPWLNRPLSSPLELLMVPASSQGRLFEEFSFPKKDPTALYSGDRANGIGTPSTPYRHLLNFFESGNDGMNFSRLFDFVHTLPRFRGEIDYLRPNIAKAIDPQLLPAPFNFSYDNTRQGTINLNTLSSSIVWRGLMQNHLKDANDLSQTFNLFRESRRGYPASFTETLKKLPADPSESPPSYYNFKPKHLHHEFPTEFAGIFRANSRVGNIDRTQGQHYQSLERTSAQAGLLRSSSKDIRTPSQTPLFVRPTPVPVDPLLDPRPPTDRLSNPFMRYQTLMRMPNLVSDNSQVFLVRMTLGFFEYDPETKSLGREYNAESGNSQRRQATFVIDRSVPIGFVPGKDLNTRDVVIFESYTQ